MIIELDKRKSTPMRTELPNFSHYTLLFFCCLVIFLIPLSFGQSLAKDGEAIFPLQQQCKNAPRFQEQLNSLEMEIQQKKKTLEDLKNDLRSQAMSPSEISKLRDEIKTLEEKIQRLNMKKDSVSKALEEASSFQQELVRLRQIQSEQQAKINKMKSLIKSAQQELALLNTKTTEKEHQKDSVDKLNKEVADLERTIHILKEQKSAFLKELEKTRTLIEQLRQLETESQKIDNKLKQANQEILEISQKLVSIKKETKEGEVIDVTKIISSSDRKIRPIYLECNARGVLVAPEKTNLSVDLTNKEKSLILSKAVATRYVVFLIRPDGYKSYNIYSEAIFSYNETHKADDHIEIGRLPIDAEWILSYPEEGTHL